MSALHRGLIRGFRGQRPQIDPAAFIADNATVIGDVAIGPRSSVWFGAVLRGDVFSIRIGADTSIQDNSVIHVTHDQYATHVGDQCTIGHSVTLHGCTVGNRCIVGMGAIILDQAVIGDDAIVGAGALVTPGTKIPPRHLAVGSPARPKRPLTDEELTWLEVSAGHYAELIKQYASDPDWQA
jgi:carbonic anhydrase/acetyltransferase-like protein (isoleucine patch superfamily)